MNVPHRPYCGLTWPVPDMASPAHHTCWLPPGHDGEHICCRDAEFDPDYDYPGGVIPGRPTRRQALRNPVLMGACHCETCGADFFDQPLPPDGIAKGYWSANDDGTCRHGCGRVAHGSREIAMYDMGVDRTTSFMCPDCGRRRVR